MNISIKQWILGVWRSPLKLNGLFLMLNSLDMVIAAIYLGIAFNGFKGNDYDYSILFRLLFLFFIASSFFMGLFFYIKNKSKCAEFILKFFLYLILFQFSITSQYFKLSYSFLAGLISIPVGFDILVLAAKSRTTFSWLVAFCFNKLDLSYSYNPTPESFFPYGLGITVNIAAILLLIHLKIFRNKTHTSTT